VAIKNGQSRDTGNNWHTGYKTNTNKINRNKIKKQNQKKTKHKTKTNKQK